MRISEKAEAVLFGFPPFAELARWRRGLSTAVSLEQIVNAYEVGAPSSAALT